MKSTSIYAHAVHWLSVAASVLFAVVELCQGDVRGAVNALGMVLGAGAMAHLKLWAAKAGAAAPYLKAFKEALAKADRGEPVGDPLTADTQEMPALPPATMPRLAPGTHPDDPRPAA